MILQNHLLLLPSSTRILDTVRICMTQPTCLLIKPPSFATRPRRALYASNSNPTLASLQQQQHAVMDSALQHRLWRLQEVLQRAPLQEVQHQVMQPRLEQAAPPSQPLQPLTPLDASLLEDLQAKERRGHWNGIAKSQWRYSDDVLRHHMLTMRGLTACQPILPYLSREVLLAMLKTRFNATTYATFANQIHHHPTWASLATRAHVRSLAPGYVYAFANKQKSRVKVGVTGEPIPRKSWHRQCYGSFVEYDVLLPTPCMRMTEELVHKQLVMQSWCIAAEPLLCRRCNAQHGEWFRGAASRQRLKTAEVQPLMVFSVLTVHLAMHTKRGM